MEIRAARAQRTDKVVAVVQARMGSTRLPNKMMLWLHGHPIVEWVWRRMAECKEVSQMAFAIPTTKENDVLAQYFRWANCWWGTRRGDWHIVGKKGPNPGWNNILYRGSEADVLQRVTQAAVTAGDAVHVVRVCADNPFVDPREVDRLIRYHKMEGADYSYNHIPKRNWYPDGVGAEVVKMDVLERVNELATSPEDREHVFNYIWDHPDEFSIHSIEPADPDAAHPDMKLDLDTYEDYIGMISRGLDIGMTATEIVKHYQMVFMGPDAEE